jgi:hypothetical protein
MTVETMRELPRSEKLKLMEALWEALSQPDDQFESPAWHANELAETERRLTQGQEQVLDWETAKKALRSSFE